MKHETEAIPRLIEVISTQKGFLPVSSRGLVASNSLPGLTGSKTLLLLLVDCVLSYDCLFAESISFPALLVANSPDGTASLEEMFTEESFECDFDVVTLLTSVPSNETVRGIRSRSAALFILCAGETGASGGGCGFASSAGKGGWDEEALFEIFCERIRLRYSLNES